MSDDLDDPFRTFTPLPAPSPAPNGTAYARAQFFLENYDFDAPKIRAWWMSQSESDRAYLIERFKQTKEYARTAKLCEWSWKRARDPLVCLLWAYNEARKAGVVK